MTDSLSIAQQMKSLEAVQEVDLKIDSLKKNKSKIPGVLGALDVTIAQARKAVDVKKGMLAETEKLHRQTRAALDLNRDRLARSQTRLEGVRNSQEHQAINKEVDQLKKLMASLEEQAKKSEADMATAQTEITALEGKVTEAVGARATQATALSGEGLTLDQQIAELMTERKSAMAGIDPRLLARYDRIRQARGGLGIAPAAGGRCKACNMLVPPQMFNEIAMAKAEHQCPSCYRILYIVATEKPL